MSIILTNRNIGALQVNAVLSENHESLATITENPIERGASINDHAYVEPKTVTLDIANENAAESYSDLVRIQAAFDPLTIVTGLLIYSNMLIESIATTRDNRTNRILRAQVTLTEVIINGTQSTQSTVNTQTDSIGESIDPVVNDQIAPVLERGDTNVIQADDATAANVLNSISGGA